MSCSNNEENSSNENPQSLATRLYLNAIIGSAGTLDLNTDVTTIGFTPVFPIKVTYSDGVKITINSMNGLKDAVYNENSAFHINNFVFPFSVRLSSNNNELIISDESEFQSLLFSLDSITTVDEYFTSSNCFEFVLPLSVIGNDGETISISNSQVLQNLLNSMSENEYWIDFVYPFQIGYGGEVITIEDVYDFYSNVDCNPNGWDCNFDFNPTCVQTSSGIIQFDNPCWAIQAGYSEDDFVSCN